LIKDLYFKIGLLFCIFGTALIIFAGLNTQININCTTSSDWQNINISGIGTKTKAKIESALPIMRISDLKAIDGVGDVKVAALAHHFTTYDTCRFEIFIGVLIGGTIFCAIGILFISYAFIKNKQYKDNIKDAVSVIAKDNQR
jgi:hypothetical protein